VKLKPMIGSQNSSDDTMLDQIQQESFPYFLQESGGLLLTRQALSESPQMRDASYASIGPHTQPPNRSFMLDGVASTH
jgi:hypothetical protein